MQLLLNMCQFDKTFYLFNRSEFSDLHSEQNKHLISMSANVQTRTI